MDGTNTYMPVMPAGYGSGFGDMGANGWWIILLFMFMGFGGGYGGFGNNNAAGFVNADVQRGFDQSAVMGGMSNIQNGITAGFGDLQTSLCGGFAGVNAAINQGFVEHEWSGMTYINREEDMGLPNLRKAKLSYHPCKLLEKYIGVFR